MFRQTHVLYSTVLYLLYRAVQKSMPSHYHTLAIALQNHTIDLLILFGLMFDGDDVDDDNMLLFVHYDHDFVWLSGVIDTAGISNKNSQGNCCSYYYS